MHETQRKKEDLVAKNMTLGGGKKSVFVGIGVPVPPFIHFFLPTTQCSSNDDNNNGQENQKARNAIVATRFLR